MTDPELTKQPADSENYYRSLIHNLHEDIIVIDSNYTITDMNNSFLATVGRSAEDVIGHNCYEVSHGYDNPCDQYGQECPLRKVFDTGLPSRCRHTHTAKDGAKVYVDVMTAPIKDSGGNITHVVEAIRDITDLMEAQAQQRASNRQYRSVVEDSPVLICRFAPGGVIEFVNDAYCRYAAKTSQELVGSDFLSLVPAGSRDAVTADISALTADSPVSSHEHQVIAEGGEIRWQRWTNRALFDKEGQIVAYQSFGEDVTERKKAEVALESMEQRLELTLQAAGIGVWDWDLVTDEAYFSPEWKAQIGYAEDELPNVYEEWESRLHPEDREQTLRAMRAYRQGQTDKYVVEFRLRHKDGSYRWISARGEMLLDDSGKPVRMNGCHLDITDRVLAEEAMREERNFAEDLIATAQAIVLVLDTEGRIVRFNPYMEAVSGYSLDEVRGKDWISTFLPRRDHKHIRKLLLRAIDDTPTRGNVNAIVTKDGRERRIEWYDKTLKDREGNIAGLLSIGHDITEREQTTRALRESEMMNRSLLEGSPVCTKIIDLDSKLQYMSAAGLRQLKIPDITPYLGQPYPPEFYPESMRASLVKGLELAKAGEISSVEAPVHDTEGNEVWYHTTFVPARGDDGRVEYIIASSVEITDRKLAEDAIADLARFPSENPYPVLRILPDGTILHANPSTARLLANQGRSADGQAPEDWLQCAETAMKSGTVVRKEFHYGQETFALHFVPLADAAYVNVYGVNVTGQKDLEAQLRQAQKMEAIGRLAGGIAHDFRNQLTVITGYADWMLSHMDDDNQYAQYMRQILDAAKRSTRLTGHLLAFSRREVLEPRVVGPMALIYSLVEPLKHMIGEDVVLVTSGADNLDNITVDPSQFEHMLVNLAVNARDAMPDGGDLRIDVRSTELDSQSARRNIDARPGKYVTITVSDTGIGMDAQTRRNAFDPFYTTKPVGEGTGLGLSMVYGFVRQSGGYITLRSKVGHGTTFKIYLPATTEQAQETESPGDAEDTTGNRATATILAVEDNQQLRGMLADILRKGGHTVLTAGNAREALPIGEHYEGQIDLLITDVVMPGMSGVELAENLKMVRPDMPVLLVSGYGDSELLRRGLTADNTELLLKPFGADELLSAVNSILA